MSAQLTLLPGPLAPLPEPGRRRSLAWIGEARRVLHGTWSHDARTVEQFAAARRAMAARETVTNPNRSTP